MIQFLSRLELFMNGPVQISLSGQETTSTNSHENYKKRRLTVAKLPPYGRFLKFCTSVRVFLSGVCDAVIEQQKLLSEPEILHRDISEGNIILTRPDKDEIIKGIPIVL
ncbi:unnamed protein product [Blumeria hordei]|uniref:non-specific serine/threonine protein kinase n=1 Tax=Blumeria hordei TaxID=2867405 RepID=A0A383V0B2_BLUHO|nr:unnamed protein product [Blumeria hordei]